MTIISISCDGLEEAKGYTLDHAFSCETRLSRLNLSETELLSHRDLFPDEEFCIELSRLAELLQSCSYFTLFDVHVREAIRHNRDNLPLHWQGPKIMKGYDMPIILFMGSRYIDNRNGSSCVPTLEHACHWARNMLPMTERVCANKHFIPVLRQQRQAA